MKSAYWSHHILGSGTSWSAETTVLLAGGWTLSGVKAPRWRAEPLTLALCQQLEAADARDIPLSFFGS